MGDLQAVYDRLWINYVKTMVDLWEHCSSTAQIYAASTAHVVKDYTNKAKTDMFLPLSER